MTHSGWFIDLFWLNCFQSSHRYSIKCCMNDAFVWSVCAQMCKIIWGVTVCRLFDYTGGLLYTNTHTCTNTCTGSDIYMVDVIWWSFLQTKQCCVALTNSSVSLACLWFKLSPVSHRMEASQSLPKRRGNITYWVQRVKI